jgi:hypothetical protein
MKYSPLLVSALFQKIYSLTKEGPGAGVAAATGSGPDWGLGNTQELEKSQCVELSRLVLISGKSGQVN